MDEMKKFSIDDDGYFGITFLDMGEEATQLMKNRVLKTIDFSHLHFDDATAHPHPDKRAITIEGEATTMSTPRFAIESLVEYARIAREMDKLRHPRAS